MGGLLVVLSLGGITGASASTPGVITIPSQGANSKVVVAPGDVVYAGYDFTDVPGATTEVANGQTQLTLSCANGSAPSTSSVTISFPDQTYVDSSQNSNGWTPSGVQSDQSVYQGSLTMPALCGAGVSMDVGQPGNMGPFTADVYSTNFSPISFRWHYGVAGAFTAGGTGTSWSGTNSVVPGPTPNSPTITTSASPTAGTVGVALTNVGDTATFHNTSSTTPPTGSVTFTLYSNSTCTNAVSGMSGSGTITTSAGTSTATWSAATWTPPASGTYYWIASYPGDVNNSGYTTTCGAADEEITVTSLNSPTITTSASPTAGTAGVALTDVGDTATFHNTSSTTPPTGSVTFTLYSNSTCTNAVSGMSGSGTITTSAGTSTATWSAATWTPPASGTYYWIASYPGDANNNPYTTACGAADEEIAVGPDGPTITTSANPTAGIAGVVLTNVGDTATFHNTSAIPPTGSVTFTLYSDSTCTNAVIGMSGSGTITTSAGVSTATWSANTWAPPASGTYYWIASYPGDANNSPYTTACGAAGEEIVVSPPSNPGSSITLAVTKANDANGSGTYLQTETAPNAGANVPFQVVVTNTSTVAVTINDLTDIWPGGTEFSPTCATAVIGTTLQPYGDAGDSVTCDFTVDDYAPAAGTSLTDTVNVTGCQYTDASNCVTVPATSTVLSPPAPATAASGGKLAFTGAPARLHLMLELGLGLASLGFFVLWFARPRRKLAHSR